MNREAIAIAADSAVTFRSTHGQKIFTSANKIFTLSKFQPVGVMIFGTALFMNVPWETIIKSYRTRLWAKRLADSTHPRNSSGCLWPDAFEAIWIC
jgi:hypothetical protein